MAEVLEALNELIGALGGRPLFWMKPSNEQAPTINFDRFKKLREPLVFKKAVEVYAPLRGEASTVPLRLEAFWSPDGACHEVVVYREETMVLRVLTNEGTPRWRDVRVWVKYDSIHSDRPTADAALEQVLGFLEMRCA